MKIELTERAQNELKRVLSTKNNGKSLRIYVAGYGWGGPSFGLALDELKEGDSLIDAGAYKFLVEEHLTESFGAFTIDYNDSWLKKGFTIMPEKGISSC